MSNRRDFLRKTGIGGMGLAANYQICLMKNRNKPFLKSDYEVTDQIKEARDIALKILKPSKRDLEHGLELHENSVVFETYGFMPRAAYDGAAVAEVMRGKASALEISDLKEDQYMTRFVVHERERQEFINNWRASGVTCIFQNAGEESNSVKVLLKRLARFTYVTDMMPEFLTKAIRPEDVIEAKNEQRHALYFSGNGVPMPLDMVSLEEELRYIRVFYQLGIRMMHLTYNRRNLIGDGCAEPANAGLSDFGRAVVGEMNRVGVLVDIAHSSWQTSIEAAQQSTKPVVASHTTCTALHQHIRSKPDAVIKAIADGGGYIGICCIPRFLGGSGDIAQMLQHIDYVVQHFGADYVGIGTDVATTSQFAAEEGRSIPRAAPKRIRWEALWPPDPYNETREMKKSMAWTNWPLFTVGLVQMGYSDDDIRKILGGNALRVLKAV